MGAWPIPGRSGPASADDDDVGLLDVGKQV